MEFKQENRNFDITMISEPSNDLVEKKVFNICIGLIGF